MNRGEKNFGTTINRNGSTKTHRRTKMVRMGISQDMAQGMARDATPAPMRIATARTSTDKSTVELACFANAERTARGHNDVVQHIDAEILACLL